MSEKKPMSEEQVREEMQIYGITAEQKTVFRYKDYKYDSLTQALDFAKLDLARREGTGESGV